MMCFVAALFAASAMASADDNHRRFGGQTETAIELAPGEHTIQLLLGDRNHIPRIRAVISNNLTIMVKEPGIAR